MGTIGAVTDKGVREQMITLYTSNSRVWQITLESSSLFLLRSLRFAFSLPWTVRMVNGSLLACEIRIQAHHANKRVCSYPPKAPQTAKRSNLADGHDR
mmetsp:Transcript_20754/g.57686  ORF Transcript_20754/g.57686 Transcript_20754/m.57686 type:complete len:98 (-) Transcript_20754:22-315(-)